MVSISDIRAPYYGNRDVWVSDKDQNVAKIITAISKKHGLDRRDYDAFSQKFWQGDAAKTGEFLFKFCKRYITYIIESEDDQTVKTPGVILHDRYGDCKHYALFITGVTDSLNRKGFPIQGNYRFVSDYPNKEVHHVFAVIRGKDGEYWVDPVINRFNERPTFYNTKDVHMSISSLSGTFNQDIAIVAGGDGEIGRKINLKKSFLNPFYAPSQALAFLKKHGKKPSDFKSKEALAAFVYNNHPTGRAAAEGMAPGGSGTANKMSRYASGFDEISGVDDVVGLFKKKAKKPGHQNFLKKLGKGIEKGAQKAKKLSLKVSLSAARGAFLSLVAINAFNLAHRLHDALISPKRAPLLKKWGELGGENKGLINATNSGYRHYKKNHGGYNIARDKISGTGTCIMVSGVGVVQVAPLLALATAIIGALAKFIGSNKKESAEMAQGAGEGVEILTKNGIQAEQLAETPAGDKALNDMTSNPNNPAVKMTTGVNSQGMPEMTVTDVQHPLIQNAGQQAEQAGDGLAQEDIVPGGGSVQTGMGSGFNDFIKKATDWASANKGKIAVGIGVIILVTKGPDIVASFKGKKRRR